MSKELEPRKTRKGTKTEEMDLLDLLSPAALPKCRNRTADFSFARPKGVSRLSRFLSTAVPK